MKKIKIEMMGAKDGDSVRGTMIRERRRNDTWHREEAFDVTSGTPGASREILLDDDERLVVEGEQTHKLVLDRDQRVATFEPADPGEAAKKRANDERIRQQNIAREERERNMTDAQRRDAAAAPVLQPYVEQQPEVATDQKPRFVEDNSPAAQPKPPASIVRQPQPPTARPSDTQGRPTQAQQTTSHPQGASSSKDVKNA